MDGEDDDSKHVEEQYNYNESSSDNAADNLNEAGAVQIMITRQEPAKKYSPRFSVAKAIIRILSFSVLPDQGIYMKQNEHNQQEDL